MTIDRFRGEHFFLSNFDETPFYSNAFECEVKSGEHAFQAHKALHPEDAEMILATASPGSAKRLGRAVILRPDWETVKLLCMRIMLCDKFLPGSTLCGLLTATGDEYLIEGNTWGDRYWGTDGGVGQNWLGFMLMGRRGELRGCGY